MEAHAGNIIRMGLMSSGYLKRFPALGSAASFGCVSLRKSKIPKESENGFCFPRLIQDLSDHDASKELKNPLWKWILRFL